MAVLPSHRRIRPFHLVRLLLLPPDSGKLTVSTLAFMMRTFGTGFGDITHYFNYRWASGFYLFEALTMPPVEVSHPFHLLKHRCK
jgi:hypothetical protein